METIGQHLRREREQRAIDLDTVATQTRINLTYLVALESDRFDRFPSEVFAKGFLRSYARCLGLDEEQALRLFAASSESFYHQKEEAQKEIRHQTEETVARMVRRTRLGRIFMAAAVVGAFSLVYVINAWQMAAHRVGPPPSESADVPEPVPLAPAVEVNPEPVVLPGPPEPQRPIAPPEAAAPVAVPATKPVAKSKPVPSKPESVLPPPSPPEAQPAPATEAKPGPTPPSNAPAVDASPALRVQPPAVNVPTTLARLSEPIRSAEPLTLMIEATDAGWVSARIDGAEMKEVFLEPGERVLWKAADGFVVNLGNAGGVRIEFNGKLLGPLGSKGAVVKGIQLSRN